MTRSKKRRRRVNRIHISTRRNRSTSKATFVNATETKTETSHHSETGKTAQADEKDTRQIAAGHARQIGEACIQTAALRQSEIKAAEESYAAARAKYTAARAEYTVAMREAWGAYWRFRVLSETQGTPGDPAAGEGIAGPGHWSDTAAGEPCTP